MAVTLTYDNTLSRVRITADGLAAADQALVERSSDQVRWTTVRGGSAVPVTSGALAVTLDDYEFSTGLNYYRVRGVEVGAITYVGAGAASTAVNAAVTPALPAGLVVGDLLLCLASIRNSGAGTVNVPAGWTLMRQLGNVSLLGRRYVAGDAAPTVAFAGGVALADTLAQVAAFRRADLVPATVADQLNASAQDVARPAVTVPAAAQALLYALWKQANFTSVALAGPTAAIGQAVSTAGSSAGQEWEYLLDTTQAASVATTWAVTGGVAATSRAAVVALQHAPYLNEQTASITPVIGDVWLKSITRPFLNRPVNVVLTPHLQVTRPARVGVFDVIGRSAPVAVNAVRGSRRWPLLIRTETVADATKVSLLLASGDPLFIQAPAGSDVEVGYVSVGDVIKDSHALRPARATFTLPLTEIAPPSPDVVGASSTWQTVINTYASWSTEVAWNATWADLLNLVGSPTEVIVQ